MARLAGFFVILAMRSLISGAYAHELRPAYLEVREISPQVYSVLWKVPAKGDMRLGLHFRLPSSCSLIDQPVISAQEQVSIERSRWRCAETLQEHEIAVDGLRASLTDVLARTQALDGSAQTARLTPEHPSFVVTSRQSAAGIGATYLRLGIEHILTGFDHLLFVLGLMLLIADRSMLLKTITAFTIAHSITLCGSALGLFTLAQQPVEATIALSIVFVASEIVRAHEEEHIAARRPWIVALIFGLLHGFGFAGALKEIGLPQSDVPLALLSFNLGVEVGQLAFVSVLLSAAWVTQSIFRTANVAIVQAIMGYMIGIAATSWLAVRVAAF